MKNFRIIILLGLFALASCNKDEDAAPQDTTRPVINSSTHLHGVIGGKINAGNKLEIHYKVSDNVGLKELKIDVHNNFDGHSHGRLAGTPYEWDTIIRLSGTLREDEIETWIPSTALAGPYHVGLFVTDAAGNQGNSFYLDFNLSNGSEPVINITAPANFGLGEIDMKPLDTLRLAGTATDPDQIEKVKIEVEEEGEHMRISSATDGEPLYKREFKISTHPSLFTDANTFQFANIINPGDLIKLPSVAPGTSKHFHVKIIVSDKLGNVRMREGELHVE
jgi:hypothetical protein